MLRHSTYCRNKSLSQGRLMDGDEVPEVPRCLQTLAPCSGMHMFETKRGSKHIAERRCCFQLNVATAVQKKEQLPTRRPHFRLPVRIKLLPRKPRKEQTLPSQTSDSTVACRPDSRKVPAPKEKATRLKITMNLNSLSLRRRRPASGSRVHQVCSQRFRMVPGTPASGLSYLTW